MTYTIFPEGSPCYNCRKCFLEQTIIYNDDKTIALDEEGEPLHFQSIKCADLGDIGIFLPVGATCSHQILKQAKKKRKNPYSLPNHY